MKLINTEDIANCWVCNEKIIYDTSKGYPFFDCNICNDFYISVQDAEVGIYIRDLIIFDGENNTTCINIQNIFSTTFIKIFHECEIDIYHYKFARYDIYKDEMFVNHFKKLNLKEYLYKIIDNYKKNMLFI